MRKRRKSWSPSVRMWPRSIQRRSKRCSRRCSDQGASHGDWVELVVSSAGKEIVLVPLMYIFVMILKAPFRSIFGQLFTFDVVKNLQDVLMFAKLMLRTLVSSLSSFTVTSCFARGQQSCGQYDQPSCTGSSRSSPATALECYDRGCLKLKIHSPVKYGNHAGEIFLRQKYCSRFGGMFRLMSCEGLSVGLGAMKLLKCVGLNHIKSESVFKQSHTTQRCTGNIKWYDHGRIFFSYSQLQVIHST